MSFGRVGLFVVLTVAGCNASNPSVAKNEQRELTVFAASSLKESFGQIAREFEQTNERVKVTLVFGGSNQLALQIVHGAPADVLATADLVQMQAAAKAGRLVPKRTFQFAQNELVVVTSRTDIRSVKDLIKPGVSLVLADPAVPAGRYASEALKKADLGPEFSLQVMKHVVSYEQDVRAVLAKVQIKEADAGVVYKTDALTVRHGLSCFAFGEWAPTARYYIAPLKGDNQDLANQFQNFVLGAAGQSALRKAGFIPEAR